MMADIWSFGIMTIEMIDSEPPLFELGAGEAMNHISNYAGATLPFPNQKPPIKSQNISPVLSIFIHKCLYRAANNRPHARELLDNDFLNRYRDGNRSVILPLNLAEIVSKAKEIKFNNELKEQNNEFNKDNLNAMLYDHVKQKQLQVETSYHALPESNRHQNQFSPKFGNILPSPRNMKKF